MKTIAECGSLVTKDKTGKITAIDPMEVMINSLTRPKYQQLLETIETYYLTNSIVQRQPVNDDSIETSKKFEKRTKEIHNSGWNLRSLGGRL
jgi:hypothetical protein